MELEYIILAIQNVNGRLIDGEELSIMDAIDLVQTEYEILTNGDDSLDFE